MSVLSSTSIRIEYRELGGAWTATEVSPTEFFDLDDEAAQAESLHDLVWRKNHATEVLRLELNAPVETVLTVRCSRTTEEITDREHIWGGGRYRAVLRSESLSGKEVRWWRLVEIQTPEGTHFLRFGSESEAASGLLSHTLLSRADESIPQYPPR